MGNHCQQARLDHIRGRDISLSAAAAIKADAVSDSISDGLAVPRFTHFIALVAIADKTAFHEDGGHGGVANYVVTGKLYAAVGATDAA